MNVICLVLLLGFVATVYGFSSARILGGTDAPAGKYPYMVAILDEDLDTHCDGSILNKRFVLTAAQCIKDSSSTGIKVKYGMTVWNDTSIEWQEVEKLIPHEKYRPGYVHYDIGLIRLKKEIEFNEKVKRVELPTSDNIDSKFTVVFTGWGMYKDDDYSYSNNLKQIALNTITHKECIKEIYSTRRHICTFTRRDEGLCYGDHGGPLVAGQYQIGIASYAFACAAGFPDVYTRVYSYLDWIEKHSLL